MLAWVQRTDKPLCSVFIFDQTFTFTFCNNEKVIRSFALLNLNFLRLTHHKLNFCDYVVLYLAIQGKNQVLLQLFAENEASDLFLQGWTDHFEELSQLTLLIERLLDILQV